MFGLTENIFKPQTNFKRKYFQVFGCVEKNATENRQPTANGGGDPQPVVAKTSNSGDWQPEIGDVNQQGWRLGG